MNAPARLNSDSQSGHTAAKPPRLYARDCPECGRAFTTQTAAQEFCGSDHKRDFNNRRLKRGAELYDLFMANRYDRPTAKALNVLSMMSKMAAEFRAEDHDTRAGRPSWRDPETVLARHPHLYATVITGRKKVSP